MSETVAPNEIPVIEARGIRKSFGHIDTLRRAGLQVKAGEILALVGDNLNLDSWKSLSKDQQHAVKRAISEAGDYETSVAPRAEQDDVDELKRPGAVIVTTPELKIDDFIPNVRKLERELQDNWSPDCDQIIGA